MTDGTAVRIWNGSPGPGRSGRDGSTPGDRPPVPLRDAGGPAPPKPMLIAAGVLAVATFLGAGYARWSGAGHVEPPRSAVIAARDLWFDDASGGRVIVRTRTAAGVDSVVTTLQSGQGMFVRGALRALARGRRQNAETADGVPGPSPRDAPFRLTRFADGRLTLDDASTGAHLELRAFGTTNEAAFAELLPGPAAADSPVGGHPQP